MPTGASIHLRTAYFANCYCRAVFHVYRTADIVGVDRLLHNDSCRTQQHRQIGSGGWFLGVATMWVRVRKQATSVAGACSGTVLVTMVYTRAAVFAILETGISLTTI
jgi:hypothetical protein